MVITSIATTYSELRVGDRIWIDSELWEIMYTAGQGNIWTVKDPSGSRHNLVQADNDPVYRVAR